MENLGNTSGEGQATALKELGAPIDLAEITAQKMAQIEMELEARVIDNLYFGNKFLVNTYRCPKCQWETTTVDLAVGKTPYALNCESNLHVVINETTGEKGACDGWAISSGYEPRNHFFGFMGDVEYEFFRPGLENEVEDLIAGIKSATQKIEAGEITVDSNRPPFLEPLAKDEGSWVLAGGLLRRKLSGANNPANFASSLANTGV